MTGADSGRRAGGWVARVVVPLVVLPVAGVLGGVLWETLWRPPQGVVVRHQWFQDQLALGADFSATGWYVVVAFVVGTVVTSVLAWLLPGRELLTLLAVLAGALVAGWAMYHVGHALGPPDPEALARTAERGATLPDDLTLGGLERAPRYLPLDTSALLALPAGALLGLAGTALTTDGRVARRRGVGTA